MYVLLCHRNFFLWTQTRQGSSILTTHVAIINNTTSAPFWLVCTSLNMAKNSIWFNLFFKKRVFLQHCFMDLKHAREWPDQASQAILFLFMLSRLHNLIMPHALRVSLLLTHKRTGSYVFDLLSCNSFYTYHHSGGKPFYDDMEKKWLDFVSIPGAAGVGCWWHLPFAWWGNEFKVIP